MSTGTMTLGTHCRSGGSQLTLTKAAVLLLFCGEGMAITAKYFAAHFSLNIPDWLLSRYNLAVALPAVLVGVRAYADYRGIAKSLPFVVCGLWMAASLVWTESTELGRGLVLFASIAVTLPLAAAIVRANLLEVGSLCFCTTFVLSLILAVCSGMQSFGGRLGDAIEGGYDVMNSNELGCMAAVALLLIYRLYEVRGLPNTHRLPAFVYTTCLPCIALCAAAMCALSVSRTAAVSLGVPALVILAWNIGKGNAAAARTVPFLILLGALLCALELVNPWLERFTDNDLGSLNGRTDIWAAGWEMTSELQVNCFCGLGMGGADKFLGQATGEGVIHPIDGILRNHSHNHYLEWLLELGVIGTAIGGWVVRAVVRTAQRCDRIDHTLHRRALLIFFALFAAVGTPLKMTAWPAIGALLWATLSTHVTPRTEHDRRRLS